MPETPVTISIDADRLSPLRLADIIREFVQLLGEIDEELSPTVARSLNWRVDALSYNSPATMTLVAEPRGNAADIGGMVIPACLRGFGWLERGSRPIEFNDDALGHVMRMAESIDGEDIRGIRVLSPLEPVVGSLTRSMVGAVERVLPYGYSIGSVEGRLESLNIHQQPRFTVWDSITGRGVRCYFRAEDLDDVKAAVGHKVLVSGRLRRDPEGRPQQIRPVEFFRSIDLPPEMPPENPVGLFSGIGDARTYLEMIRGE